MKQFLILLFALLIFFPLPSLSAEVDQVLEAQWAKKEKELISLQAAAEKGDAKAQYELGHLYYCGTDINGCCTSPQSPESAIPWFRKSISGLREQAEHGDTDAQYKLGMIYSRAAWWLGNRNARYVHIPEEAAGKWFGKAAPELHKAAEQGDPDAQNKIGKLYYYGHGVQKDHSEAAKWLRKAAEQNNPEAQYTLGYMYSSGEGVPRDWQEAIKWYQKAYEQGSLDAAGGLEQVRFWICAEKAAAPGELTDEQVAKLSKSPSFYECKEECQRPLKEWLDYPPYWWVYEPLDTCIETCEHPPTRSDTLERRIDEWIKIHAAPPASDH